MKNMNHQSAQKIVLTDVGGDDACDYRFLHINYKILYACEIGQWT